MRTGLLVRSLAAAAGLTVLVACDGPMGVPPSAAPSLSRSAAPSSPSVTVTGGLVTRGDAVLVSGSGFVGGGHGSTAAAVDGSGIVADGRTSSTACVGFDVSAAETHCNDGFVLTMDWGIPRAVTEKSPPPIVVVGWWDGHVLTVTGILPAPPLDALRATTTPDPAIRPRLTPVPPGSPMAQLTG